METDRFVGSAKALARRVLPADVQAWIRDVRHPDIPLVPVQEVTEAYRRAVRHLVATTGKPLGDYLEFGVFRGDSLLCMDRVRREAGLSFRLFGFDSFRGLPQLSHGDESLGWSPGSFHSSYRSTRRRLTKGGVDWSCTILVEGWYEQTLTPQLVRRHELAKASLIMIDCDLYSSTRTALEFSLPLIVDETIVFFDDWDGGSGLADRGEGEARAFDEFLEQHPELAAEEFDTYLHTELDPPPVAKVFRLRRVGGGEPAAPAGS